MHYPEKYMIQTNKFVRRRGRKCENYLCYVLLEKWFPLCRASELIFGVFKNKIERWGGVATTTDLSIYPRL